MPDPRGLDVLNNLLLGVLDALPYPFYVIDVEDYSIVLANKAAAEGIPPGRMTCYQLTHRSDAPCDDPLHPCPLTYVRETGEPIVVEHIHYDKEGNPRVTEVHAYPVRLKGDEILFMAELCVDITARRRAEAQAQRNQAELAAVLDAAPVLMMTLDEERRVRRANRAVAEFVGAPRESLYGQRLGEVLRCIHASDDLRGCGFGPSCGMCSLRNLIADTLQKRQPFYQREVTLLLGDGPPGRNYTFWAASVPLVRPTETLALLSLQDITPLKRALARTKRLLTFQETLHDILASAAHAEDLPALLKIVLDAVMDSTGVKAGAVWVGQEKVVSGVDETVVSACIRAAKETSLDWHKPIVISDVFRDHLAQPVYSWAVQAMIPFNLQALLGVPILTDDTCIGGLWVACFHPRQWSEDETVLLSTIGREVGTLAERLMLISRLQEVNTQLEEALKIKDIVLQNVSHELRTPLTLLKGYLDVMEEGVLGDLSAEQHNAIDVMRKNIERLEFMVNRLLLMRTIRGEVLQREPIAMARWLQAVAEEWRHTIEGQDSHFVVEISPNLPTIQADPQLLRQAVDNLIHNALKFSPQGGTIRLKAWQEGDEVIIAVSDEGIGIPADELDRIFDRFYQVEGGMRRRFGGLGIGLSLCKDIAELHGGRIWAESEGPNKGATFYIALPIHSKSEAP